ncbi:hypothetical protein BE221DRAFT_88046 [Ostreococcus tauri]|uniref:Uncharacterized protein n=1 Tax=Ostreococcus tauri TaxID=70448 RepID=A0A1Y5IJ59_OSTTA|nr:hypothetical protein BE221DRAFT_88046 [Ostreococcus tauri]
MRAVNTTYLRSPFDAKEHETDGKADEGDREARRRDGRNLRTLVRDLHELDGGRLGGDATNFLLHARARHRDGRHRARRGDGLHATFEKHPEGYSVSPRSVPSLHDPNLTRRHSRTTAHQPHASPRARYPMDRASPSTPRPHRASTPRTTSTAHHRPRARTKRFIADHITPTSTASRPRSIVRARPFVRSPIEAVVAIASRAFESLASLDAPSGALRGDAHGGDARR